jgi:hypothetical protein
VRDSQRSRVYAAENACSWAKYGQTIPNNQLQAWAEQNILSKAWFRKRFGDRYPAIELGRGGGKAYTGLFTAGRITLGVEFRNAWGMCHEMAHIISHDSHGPAFARNYLFLVEKVIGKAEADELKAKFKEHRVKMIPASKMPLPTRQVSQMPARIKATPAPKTKRPRNWNVTDVERLAKKLGATVQYESMNRGRWFDLEVIAPEGKVWADQYDGDCVEVKREGTMLATYGFESSYFTKSERIAELITMMEEGLRDPAE